MEDLAHAGPTLPLYASLPLALLFSALVLLLLSRTGSNAARFLIFAAWLRYLLSAFHTFSFSASPAGMSWNALASIGVVGLGLLIVRRRPVLQPVLLPLYPLFGLLIFSGMYSGQMSGLIGTFAKYGYFAIFIVATIDALEDIGAERLFRLLLVPLAIPLLFQIASVALGVVKAGEGDGSASYIGGFNHEAAFSVALATGLMILCFAERLHVAVKAVLLTLFCGGLVLANYRTTILAMAPLLVATLLSAAMTRVPPRQRVVMLVGAGLVIACLGLGAIGLGGDRFADLAAFESGNSGPLIKPAETFTVEERRLLSGRPYIWSQYLYAYARGGPVTHLIGFGPDAWTKTMPLYAHNTLVSVLYELGAFGLVVMLFLWISMLILAMRVHGPQRVRIIGAHVSFILIGMATMPMWQIEGLLLYGLLCGYTAYLAGSRATAETGAADDLERRLRYVERSTLELWRVPHPLP